jgi:hypothetical protein
MKASQTESSLKHFTAIKVQKTLKYFHQTLVVQNNCCIFAVPLQKRGQFFEIMWLTSLKNNLKLFEIKFGQ